AEGFIAQMRVRNRRLVIVRDGHEPNEAEEQRPCCVPIDPVHVISSPKRAVENRKFTRNSCSLGEEGGIDNDTWTTKFILRCGIGKNVRRESQTAARLPALRRAHLPTAIAPRISSRQPENGRRAATISPISGTHNRQHEYPCC